MAAHITAAPAGPIQAGAAAAPRSNSGPTTASGSSPTLKKRPPVQSKMDRLLAAPSSPPKPSPPRRPMGDPEPSTPPPPREGSEEKNQSSRSFDGWNEQEAFDAFGDGMAGHTADPADSFSENERSGLVSEQVFAGAFRAAFDLSGELAGLQSLKVQPAEVEACDTAAGGLYAVVLKHPSLHWMLRTDGAYMKLAIATMPFVWVKARAAAMELRARRATDVTPNRENPSQGPQAA